jgi:hypothetical protein
MSDVLNASVCNVCEWAGVEQPEEVIFFFWVNLTVLYLAIRHPFNIADVVHIVATKEHVKLLRNAGGRQR